jgi:hypothetical protein
VHRFFNQSKRKQSTAMKQKYAEPNLRDNWGHLLRKPGTTQDPNSLGLSEVVVGDTRVCYFIDAAGKPELVIGLVRSIRAAVTSVSKSGRESSKLKFYRSTHDQDGSASFVCFPYYQWTAGGNTATLCVGEKHEYFPLLLDGDSDEVQADDSQQRQPLAGVTCLRFPVSVRMSVTGSTLAFSDGDVALLTELAGKVQLDVPDLPVPRRMPLASDTDEDDDDGDVPLGVLAAAVTDSETCGSEDDVPVWNGRRVRYDSAGDERTDDDSDTDDDVPLGVVAQRQPR